MDLNTKDNSQTTTFMALEPTLGLMAETTREIGKTTRWMDKENLNGLVKFQRIIIYVNLSNLVLVGLFVLDERKYNGSYVEDKKHGYGEFEWPDGRRYKG